MHDNKFPGQKLCMSINFLPHYLDLDLSKWVRTHGST